MRHIAYVFFSQHLSDTRHLILGSCVIVSNSRSSECESGLQRAKRTDDERNHRGSISSGGLEALDQLLDLPDLDL